MNPGDMVVCGVIGDILLDDIPVIVPKGIAIRIPAEQTLRSRDLHRALSQGTIFRLDIQNLLQQQLGKARPGTPPAPPPVVEPLVNEALEAENLKLKADVSRLTTENSRLNGEVGRLQAELARAKKELADTRPTQDKLDEILTKLAERPATQVVHVHEGANGKVEKSTQVVEEDAPVFIPSQIRPENVDTSRIAVQEGSAGSKGVSQAANALRRLKKEDKGSPQ